MNAKNLAQRLLSRRVRRSLVRTIPLLGTVFAGSHVYRRIRDKGARRGGIDAALDLTPGVGTIKAIYEMIRGDLISAKSTARSHG